MVTSWFNIDDIRMQTVISDINNRWSASMFNSDFGKAFFLFFFILYRSLNWPYLLFS